MESPGVTGHRRALRNVAALVAAATVAAGCGGTENDSRTGGRADDPVVEDPGPVHVHGLGVDPRDRALFIATHTGLFRAPDGEQQSKRVAERFQDTMAFTVVGPNRFLGSGHPDGREKLPPYLGLIESRDAGRTWTPISLQGEVDFHLLEVAGRLVYGFGSDFESRRPRFMVSANRGRTWSDRRIPQPFISLAVDPENDQRSIASGDSGLYLSPDAGKTWRPLRGAPGLLAWPRSNRLYRAAEDGSVSVSTGAGRGWRAVGRLGGAPSAFDLGRGTQLLAALHDGTVKESTDGGATWKLRSRP